MTSAIWDSTRTKRAESFSTACLQWIAAGDGINMNYRFSQPGRTERNRQDQLYAEGVFPFANQRTTDPITGKTAGRYDKCTYDENVPAGHGSLLSE